MIPLAVAAFLGGLATTLMGWFASDKPFNGRKFGASVIRAIIAGVVFAVGHEMLHDTGIIGLALAFLSGAGVEVGGHRLAGALKKKKLEA